MRDSYKITDKDGVHFITSTIIEWLPVFTQGSYFEIIIDSLKYCMRSKVLKLYAFVILDNHFHLIVSSSELAGAISSLKKFTASKIIEQLNIDEKKWLLNQLLFYKKKYKKASTYQVWQEGIHPMLISSPDMLKQKIDYIHYNPVKRGLVDLPEQWRYSSARNYLLDDHSIIGVDCSLL